MKATLKPVLGFVLSAAISLPLYAEASLSLRTAIVKLRGVIVGSATCQARGSLKGSVAALKSKHDAYRNSNESKEKKRLHEDMTDIVADMQVRNNNLLDKLNPLCDTVVIDASILDVQELLSSASAARDKEVPDSEFDEFISRLNKKGFAKDKLPLLKSFANESEFTVDQVTKIFGAFTWDRDKISAAEIVKNKITDKRNIYKLYDEMRFSDAKKKLREVLEP